jgi:ATP-binding cassette subfamily C protein CydC
VLEILDAEPLVVEPTAPAPPPKGFAIAVEKVSFTYRGAQRPALNGIDLQWPEGAKIALLGPTGAGKTTLVNLLLRFWPPDRGRITLGGTDIAALGGEEVRRQIAVVSQHTHLFSGTIRENLLLADPAASQQRLEQACRSAEIHGFIAAQPEGYETQVGESGVALSGGQARRLAIARALLKDAPILVLDEPTEGLDGPTARALMHTLHGLMDERTVLLITHRPEGLDDMDRILMLDQGSLSSSCGRR